jgi:hypothetical protein
LGKFFEGIAVEDVGIFNCHFVNFMAKWYILWPFGAFCGHLVHLSPVLVCCTEKHLATLCSDVAEQAFRPIRHALVRGGSSTLDNALLNPSHG